MPNFIKILSTIWLCLHCFKCLHTFVYCAFDLWPLTSKINRVYLLDMVHMSAMFDEDAHNGLVSIAFTRSRCNKRKYRLMEPLYQFCNALPKDNKVGHLVMDNMCQVQSKYIQQFALRVYHVHKATSIYVYSHYKVWPWPLTSNPDHGQHVFLSSSPHHRQHVLSFLKCMYICTLGCLFSVDIMLMLFQNFPLWPWPLTSDPKNQLGFPLKTRFDNWFSLT